MNRKAAEQAVQLYKALAAQAEIIDSVRGATGNPLQKVSFTVWTPCFSGRHDYHPAHMADAIMALVELDMALKREAMLAELQSLGYAAP